MHSMFTSMVPIHKVIWCIVSGHVNIQPRLRPCLSWKHFGSNPRGKTTAVVQLRREVCFFPMVIRTIQILRASSGLFSASHRPDWLQRWFTATQRDMYPGQPQCIAALREDGCVIYWPEGNLPANTDMGSRVIANCTPCQCGVALAQT